jgi:hypothetical protein
MSPFLLACIPTRTILSILAFKTPDIPNIKVPLAIILTLIAIGFMVIYIFDLRKTGIEVGGGLIWWNKLRPLHSIMYFLAAYLVFHDQRTSGHVLAIDAVIGLIAFLLK